LPATDSPKKLVVIVVDGLTPEALERAVERGRAPALAFLLDQGVYTRGVSVFPSLTPVCMSSLTTGAYPDVHRIPHLVWYDRDERRFVEYGSSFGAIVAAGTRRSIMDTIFGLNEQHLGPEAVTLYEALEDAGLVAAAVNATCYRGRTRHRVTLPGLTRTTLGPRRFFYYNLFESDETGAPLAVRKRSAGTVDGYAAAVGRWLVTRDGFDFLFYYLSDYDYASHLSGPDAADAALERADDAIAALLDAAGDWDDFLERYAIVLCSDHGQTSVTRAVRLEERLADLRLFQRGTRRACDVAVAASNRAAQIYRLPGCRSSARELAERLDREPSVEASLYLEDGVAVARSGGEEQRFTPDDDLPFGPDAAARAWAALHNPRAGDVLVSAAPGYEFSDLGGRSHIGGGSHGSLCAGDSEVPMVTIGLGSNPRSIVDVAPAVLAHFGVAA
jgi:predicted AlkP superfamily pyrophosphatase or phosphodiesterase